jgi:hypothetical protein
MVLVDPTSACRIDRSPHIVSSDIDATKRMLRRRGWVGHFFSASKAQEGDTVVLTSPSPYQVRVYLERTEIGKQ